MELNVGQWLVPFLSGVPAVTALVAARIYPVAVPQAATAAWPVLTYRRLSSEFPAVAAGWTGVTRPRVRISAWSTDYDQALGALGAVIEAFRAGGKSELAGFHVRAALVVDSGDDFHEPVTADELFLFGPWVDLQISYTK